MQNTRVEGLAVINGAGTHPIGAAELKYVTASMWSRAHPRSGIVKIDTASDTLASEKPRESLGFSENGVEREGLNGAGPRECLGFLF